VDRVQTVLKYRGTEPKREAPDPDSANCNVMVDAITTHRIEDIELCEHYVATYKAGPKGEPGIAASVSLRVQRGTDTLMSVDLLDGKIQRVGAPLTDPIADKVIRRTAAALRREHNSLQKN